MLFSSGEGHLGCVESHEVDGNGKSVFPNKKVLLDRGSQGELLGSGLFLL